MFELLLSRCGCSSGGNVIVAMDEKIKVFNTTTHIVQVLFHWKNSERERSVNNLIHKELKGRYYLFLMLMQVSVLQVPFFKA